MRQRESTKHLAPQEDRFMLTIFTFAIKRWGRHAERITSGHALDCSLGEGSPLPRLYDLDGSVLLLGVGYESNTSFHLVEYRVPDARETEQGAPILDGDQRVWATFRDIVLDEEPFVTIGKELERERPGVRQERIGLAEVCSSSGSWRWARFQDVSCAAVWIGYLKLYRHGTRLRSAPCRRTSAPGSQRPGPRPYRRLRGGTEGSLPVSREAALCRRALHYRYLCRIQRDQRIALITQVELGERAHPPAPAVGVIAAWAERNQGIGLAAARAHPDGIHGPTLLLVRRYVGCGEPCTALGEARRRCPSLEDPCTER